MEKEMTPNESLEIISRAISQAKRNAARGGSFQILWWGWVIALANLGHYILYMISYQYPYVVWIVTIPAVIVSALYGYNTSKKSKVVSHMDQVYGHIWTAAFVAIMTLVVFMSKLGYNHNPAILLVAGVGMYTTGILLKFKPVIIGAIVLWLGAVIAFFVGVHEQYLVAGITIMIGYLIPGYLLKKAEH